MKMRKERLYKSSNVILSIHHFFFIQGHNDSDLMTAAHIVIERKRALLDGLLLRPVAAFLAEMAFTKNEDVGGEDDGDDTIARSFSHHTKSNHHCRRRAKMIISGRLTLTTAIGRVITLDKSMVVYDQVDRNAVECKIKKQKVSIFSEYSV